MSGSNASREMTSGALQLTCAMPPVGIVCLDSTTARLDKLLARYWTALAIDYTAS